MSAPHLVVRDDDPRRPALEADGYRVTAESWGAQLTADRIDHDHLERLIARAATLGGEVTELTSHDAADICALDALTVADYPGGPANAHAPLTPEKATALCEPPRRVFGIRIDGALVAMTAVDPDGDTTETDFTAVAPRWRGRGLGAAVKAASIAALAARGIRTFRTGGAAVNDASLGVNRAVGYEVDERWLTYEPSTGPQA